MRQYLNSLQLILDKGTVRENRTGINTISVFGHQERFNLQEGFPATTTKKLAFSSVVSELIWFLEGSGDERRLAEIRYGTDRGQVEDKKTIWTANAEAGYWKHKAQFDGDLGRVYGVQWRKWRTFDNAEIDWTTDKAGVNVNFKEVDQIANIIDTLKNNPNDRRILLYSVEPR